MNSLKYSYMFDLNRNSLTISVLQMHRFQCCVLHSIAGEGCVSVWFVSLSETPASAASESGVSTPVAGVADSSTRHIVVDPFTCEPIPNSKNCYITQHVHTINVRHLVTTVCIFSYK